MSFSLQDFYIKKSDIKESLNVTAYRANQIFNQYLDKLTNAEGVQFDRSCIPKDWFIENYATDHKLSELNKKMMYENFNNKKEGDKNEAK